LEGKDGKKEKGRRRPSKKGPVESVSVGEDEGGLRRALGGGRKKGQFVGTENGVVSTKTRRGDEGSHIIDEAREGARLQNTTREKRIKQRKGGQNPLPPRGNELKSEFV